MKNSWLIVGGLLAALCCGTIRAEAADIPDAVRPCSETSNKMDDVYCIGDRRVAHRSFISLQKEIAIGTQYAKQIDRSSKLIKDPVITEYVNRVEQNIAQNSDAKIPITVRVIDSPSVNAFTLPGGYIYVDTGLIQAAGSEAQLAAVLAHETGHVAARHWAAQQTKESLLRYAMIPLIFTPMSYPVYLGVSEGLNIGIPLSFLKFSREDEAQADFLGVQYLWKAGYDPHAFLAMFGKLMQVARRHPGSTPGIFMDHPPTKERIIDIAREIKTMLPQRRQYLVSTSEFQGIQHRLNMELARMKHGDPGHFRPTLRHRSPHSTQPGQGGKGQQNDKPPILRRRG